MHLRLICAALVACAGTACTSGPTLDSGSTAVQVATTLPAPSASDQAVQREFRIGPFDTLAVQVFGAPDLTREGMVDASGTFAMPLIGDVPAMGLTAAELQTAIADRLRGRYVRDPQVTVAVREVRSQRVTVDGAVRQPGVYPLTGRTYLQQAIAMARGADEFARLDQVVIFRNVSNQRMAARFSLKDIRSGRMPDPEIYGNDTIVVGENAARRRFKDILQSLPVLGAFTPIL